VSLVTILPFIVLIGAMFLMTRSAKKKQQAAASMRNDMQPGSGVRTIGGMYALVKEVHDDMVLLEVAPGVHAAYAKNSIGAVLADEEYNRIVNGDDGHDDDLDLEGTLVPDDASSLIDADSASEGSKIDLGKKPEAVSDEPADAKADTDTESADAEAEAKSDATSEVKAGGKREAKTDGEADAK
jgi:preprotein translocase subunit YajC